MEEFVKLGLNENLIKAIKDEGFNEPTEIQKKAIPLVLKGKDVVAGSATGSGKTLAFSAGAVQNYTSGKGIQVLILTPTRELCMQVAKAFKQFSKYNPLRVAIVYGGVGIEPQISALKKADVVAGTPGRVLDHISRNTINLRNVKTLVLDEADRMLDMGFIDDVEKIIRVCPKERQTLLFSATISTDINRLCHRYMKDPFKISAESYVDPSKLKQVYYDVPDNLKFSLLVHLLKKEHSGLVMVFCNTRDNADFVGRNLKINGIDAMIIHGGFSQQKRTKTMESFTKKGLKVLVCTDVAARGLDIKGVTHVYNYDIPKDSKEYVHRIGRTARAGSEGMAINILASRDHENFGRVEKENISIRIKKLDLPKVEKVIINKGSARGRMHSSQRKFSGGGFRREKAPSRGESLTRGQRRSMEKYGRR